MNVSGKKLFLIGFVVVLLVGIPLTVYLLQKQQETRSRAEKSTNISFSPESSEGTPIQKNIGDSVPLDIMIDPGKNLVSFVKLEMQYDPDKLATASSNAFQVNTSVFPTVMEGPIYSQGKVSVTLAIGPDPTKAIQTKVKAATITFRALANTAGTPTRVTYGSNTQVLSEGGESQASENVLSSAIPATIVIGASSSTTIEPIPSGTPEPTAEVIPTEAVPTQEPQPTTPPAPTATPMPTQPSTTGTASNPPVCNSLVVDRSTAGTAPYTLTFTANGTSGQGSNSSISKVTFNFGDGGVSDVTAGGGIGTSSVNVQVSHTYENPGTYTASAVLTDGENQLSYVDTICTQTITVDDGSTDPGTNPGGSGGGGGAVATTAPASGTATPTIAPTGSAEIAMGLGLGMLLLIVGGGLLFFIL